MSEPLFRHWLMLQAIPRYPAKIDAARIQRELEDKGFSIHRRSIERDLRKISEEGIFPLEKDSRSRPYGWYWPANVKPFDIPSMDTITALSFVLVQQHIRNLLPSSITQHIQHYFEQAHAILKKTKGRKKLSLWPDKVRLLDRGPLQKIPEIDNEVQSIVHNALLQNVQFHALYRHRDKNELVEFDVNPLGLVYKTGIVYLVCTLWQYQDIRQLAMHRIINADLSSKPVSIPKGFNLDEYIAKGEFGYPRTPKKIKLKAIINDYIHFHLTERPISDTQKIKEIETSKYMIEATVPDTEELRWWIIGFGGSIEILKPEVLRKELIEVTNRMHDIYQ